MVNTFIHKDVSKAGLPSTEVEDFSLFDVLQRGLWWKILEVSDWPV